MARTRRARLVSLGAICAVFIIALLGVCETTEGMRTEQPHASATVGELVMSASVGQAFLAKYSGLSRLEVRLATYGRPNTGSVIIHLTTSPGAEDLFMATVDAASIEDNEYRVFEFSPIRNSAGCSYYFYLEAPHAEAGNAISVWGVADDVYPDGEAVLHGVVENGVQDLTFRLGYDPSLPDRVEVFVSRVVSNKPSIWGDRRLYTLLFVAYLVLLLRLVFLWASRADAGADGA